MISLCGKMYLVFFAVALSLISLSFLVDRFFWILFLRGSSRELAGSITRQLQREQLIEHRHRLVVRGKLVARRHKAEQLIAMASPQLVRQIIFRIFGPREPCCTHSKPIEIGFVLLPETVHVILVLMSDDNQVQVAIRRFENAGDDVVDLGKTKVWLFEPGL